MMEADAKTKQAAYENLQKEIEERVVTWQDMYTVFHEKMETFKKSHEPTHALEAMYHMYAFILSLEALPEEGNIKVIAEYMIRVMVYESREKLGADMITITPEDIQTTARVLGTLGAHSLVEHGPPGETTETENKPEVKRHLH
jgi:hypothetical protein